MDGSRPAGTRPQPLGDETEHYWLVQRMAKATGVDLVRATETGLLTQEQWSGIVTRCRGCQWAARCDHWLDMPRDEPRDIPDPCLNRQRLAALKDALEETDPRENDNGRLAR